MSEDLLAIIVCPPEVVDNELRSTGVISVKPCPGAICGVCDNCGQSIWIGPKSMAKSQEMNSIVLCFNCAAQRMAAEGLTPETAKVISLWRSW